MANRVKTQTGELQAADEIRRLQTTLAWYKKRDEVVLRLISRFRATPDLPGIFQTAASEIGKVLKAEHCTISLDFESSLLARQYQYSTSPGPNLGENRAKIAAPIMLQHELIGTIRVEDKAERSWAVEEITFAHTIANELALLVANSRLTAENQRQQREISQLRTLARLTAEETDPYQLARQLTEQVLHLLDAEQGMIGFVQDETIVVDQFYRYGRWQEVDLTFHPGIGVAGWVLVNGRPYLSQDAHVDPHVDPALVEKYDCRTVLAVPILSGRRVLGVIELQNRRDEQPFREEDVSYAQTIAHQAAIALERTQLFKEMERRTNALETLLAVSAELNEQLNPSLLIRRLVEHAANLVGATAGFGGLTDGSSLQVGGYWLSDGWTDWEDKTPGLPNWVVENKRPYLTNDYRHDKEASPELTANFDVRAALCVPILNVNDQVLGFLEVHNKGNGREPFSWADVGMLESLANAAAVALGNTYLFKELDNQGTQLRALSAQLVTLLEDERRRIARELHDEAGQLLIGIKINLRILANQIPDNLPDLRSNVDHLRQEVNRAAERLQALSRGLRPPTLDELGLEPALSRLTADFEQTSGVKVKMETAVFPSRLEQPVEIACYRIVQEALTNIARHAQAKKVQITLTQNPNSLLLKIKDDGSGFEIEQTPSAGLGLLGMRERANMLGGHFAIVSKPGRGTQITVEMPLDGS